MNKHIRHLKKVDPVLGEVIERVTPAPLQRRENHFEALITAIANQQLSGKAARTILNHVLALFKPGRFPTPQEYLKMSDARLRATGLSNAKVRYTKNVAQFFVDHAKEIKKIDQLEDGEVIRLLTGIKGIGIWSAEMFLMFSLGREDVFSFGDLGLRNGLQKLYGSKKPLTLKQMQKIVETWKPYRTHAARYLWASLREPVKPSVPKMDVFKRK